MIIRIWNEALCKQKSCDIKSSSRFYLCESTSRVCRRQASYEQSVCFPNNPMLSAITITKIYEVTVLGKQLFGLLHWRFNRYQYPVTYCAETGDIEHFFFIKHTSVILVKCT